MQSFLKDPVLAALIDAAVAPYRGRWTAQQIELFRERVAQKLMTDPALQARLTAELAAGIHRSGEVLTEAGRAAEAERASRERRSKAR